MSILPSAAYKTVESRESEPENIFQAPIITLSQPNADGKLIQSTEQTPLVRIDKLASEGKIEEETVEKTGSDKPELKESVTKLRDSQMKEER